MMDCEEYNKIFTYINDGTYYKQDIDDNERRRIRKRTKNFEINEGEMYYIGGKKKKGDHTEDKKLVITSDKKLSILQLCHSENGSHLGMEKTFYKLAERYYWKGMSADVKHHIQHCEQCQSSNKKTKTTPTELQSVPVPKSTWKKIAIDLIGPYHDSSGKPLSTNGYRYVLTVIDYFSNYVEAFPLKRKFASEVAEKMYELFCRHGMPLELVSDNGGEFNSGLTAALEAQYGYKHILITPYHPQSNGRSERFNQTLKAMLNKTVEENTSNWERYVPKCCFSYNTSKQASTKYSPFYLMFWRNPILPNENMHGETANTFEKYKEIPETEIEKAATDMLEIQTKIAANVCDNVQNAQNKQKFHFDKRHNVAQNEFKVGDSVLVKNLKRKKTLGMAKWLGPYTVHDIPRLGTLTLIDTNDKIVGKYRQNNVKRYYESDEVINEQSLDKTEDETDQQADEIEKDVVNMSKEGQDENNNISDIDGNDDSIFLTRSTFQKDDAAVFDLEVGQLLSFPSPRFDSSEDNNNGRPKRQCVGKQRRNSIYEYFPVIKSCEK